MESLQQMKVVPDEILEQRIVEVKLLSDPKEETEQYRIVKDASTGEHYLHYAYMHIDVANSSEAEWFHQFMPIESDEVLSFAMGETPYKYPEHWNRIFLRNGPLGQYVWFEPDTFSIEEKYEKLGQDIQQVLQQYKEKGQFDQKTMEKMWKDIDRLG